MTASRQPRRSDDDQPTIRSNVCRQRVSIPNTARCTHRPRGTKHTSGLDRREVLVDMDQINVRTLHLALFKSSRFVLPDPEHKAGTSTVSTSISIAAPTQTIVSGPLVVVPLESRPTCLNRNKKHDPLLYLPLRTSLAYST
jgi:hypothetical protein